MAKKKASKAKPRRRCSLCGHAGATSTHTYNRGGLVTLSVKVKKPKVARIALRYNSKGHYWVISTGWGYGSRPSDANLIEDQEADVKELPHLCFVDIELPEPVVPPSAKVLRVKAVKR